jgi:hypothetical protein
VTGTNGTGLRSVVADVKLCLAAGLLFAGPLCVIAVLVFVFKGRQSFDANETSLMTVMLVYLTAGIVGGLTVGVSLRLTKWIWGAALVGFVTAFIVWFLVGWSISPLEPLQSILKSSVLLAGAFGLPISIGLWYQLRRYRRTGEW